MDITFNPYPIGKFPGQFRFTSWKYNEEKIQMNRGVQRKPGLVCDQ